MQDPDATYILDPMIQPGTGSLDVVGSIQYVNPGVQVALPQRSNAYAFVPFPAYRDVRDQQLTPRFSVLLGVSKSF